MAELTRREVGVQTYREVLQTDPPARPSVFQCNGRLDRSSRSSGRAAVLNPERATLAHDRCARGPRGDQHAPDAPFGALKSGDISVDELQESIYHFALYRGFGRAQAFEETTWEVADELGLEPTGACDLSERAWPDEDTRVQAGRFEFSAVMVFPPPAAGLRPVLRMGASSRPLFAEMWTRGVLAPRERRLITWRASRRAP